MNPVIRKQAGFVLALLLSFFLTYHVILSLSALRNTVAPEIYLIRAALGLFAFYFPILLGWFSFRVVGGAIFALYASIMVFFVSGVTASSFFLWFLFQYAALYYLLFRKDQMCEDALAGISVDKEQSQNQKNDLEVAHKAKGEGISILFEKYSTYYNLRKLAEQLATSLSVSQLGQVIVNHAGDLIGRGEWIILSLTNTEGLHLTNLASRHVGKASALKTPPPRLAGDLFDSWVVKNQRRLIVNHAHQDFRFDVKEAAKYQDAKSMIIAPLLHERKVMGVLRVQSSVPEAFSNDDLRLLDTIAVLASSALSNAILFEQTEELAIKDSLTGLFLRRYFFARFKEEHRRALMTHRPLSLIMCDLDHFKNCNDKYGHGIGDLMLVQFSQILKKEADHAIVARYGGEEFAVLLPEVARQEALELAEKIRKAVENYSFEVRRERISMTVSAGVASLPEDTLEMEQLIQKADEAMYSAKRMGRNRVC